jgi:hypothetical protein
MEQGKISLLFTVSKPSATAAFTPLEFTARDTNPDPPLMISLEKLRIYDISTTKLKRSA